MEQSDQNASRRTQWLRKLCDEFIKLEPLFPVENFLPDEGLPKWVQNLERELGATMYPVAKIKEGFEPTPKRLGGIIGHACAYGVWLVEWVAKLTPEQLVLLEEFILRLSVRLSCGKRSITGQIVVALQRRLGVASPSVQASRFSCGRKKACGSSSRCSRQ